MPTSSHDRGSLAYVLLLTLVAALGGLLFGYDTAVISGAIGFLESHFNLDPQLGKGWAAASALIGCAVGAAFAGLFSDRLGRKKVLVLSGLMFFVSSLGTALPRDFTPFIIFRIMAGIGIGAASIASPMYIAEISPARIRGRLISVNQFAIVAGILVVFIVNYFIAQLGTAIDRRVAAQSAGSQGAALSAEAITEFLVKRSPDAAQEDAEDANPGEGDESKLTRRAIEQFVAGSGVALDSHAAAQFAADHGLHIDHSAFELASLSIEPWNERRGWRWMFGCGALPSLVFLALLLLVPESPRWLAEKRREGEALAVLTRVGGSQHAAAELADIKDAISRESGSLAQLFQPGMRIVLVMGVTLAVLQQITGINVFMYFAPEIFKKMGSGTDTALLQEVIVGVVNLTFTVIAIWTVDWLGRKPLMIVGATGMGLCLTALGLAAYFQRTDVWVLTFILGYIACFAMSLGPVVWVVLAEIFPTAIRGRAMGLAIVCLWLANSVVIQTFTIMDGSEWLVSRFHHGFPFWVYAVLCGVTALFVWRFVPETKGKTLEEIERGWERRGEEVVSGQ